MKRIPGRWYAGLQGDCCAPDVIAPNCISLTQDLLPPLYPLFFHLRTECPGEPHPGFGVFLDLPFVDEYSVLLSRAFCLGQPMTPFHPTEVFCSLSRYYLKAKATEQPASPGIFLSDLQHQTTVPSVLSFWFPRFHS